MTLSLHAPKAHCSLPLSAFLPDHFSINSWWVGSLPRDLPDATVEMIPDSFFFFRPSTFLWHAVFDPLFFGLLSTPTRGLRLGAFRSPQW